MILKNLLIFIYNFHSIFLYNNNIFYRLSLSHVMGFIIIYNFFYLFL